LAENRADLERAAERWLPRELTPQDRAQLIGEMSSDVIAVVDNAIGFIGVETTPDQEPAASTNGREDDVPPGENAGTEPGEEDTEFVDPAADKLLDRLLYWGVLPRYAFPTDVAPFYVFNRALSTPYRPKMEFAPSQGLNIALSQYAPNKQIWIKHGGSGTKVAYPTENGEQVWIGSWIDGREARFVIALQKIRTEMSACDISVLQRQTRIDDRAPDHLVRVRKIVIIVAVGTAEGDHGRNGIAAPSCATGALLIVRASWWHIAQGNAGEFADVDTDLHRRRT
jgi:hypothetical protein